MLNLYRDVKETKNAFTELVVETMEAEEFFCSEYWFSCVSTIVTLISINLLNSTIYGQRNKTNGS